MAITLELAYYNCCDEPKTRYDVSTRASARVKIYYLWARDTTLYLWARLSISGPEITISGPEPRDNYLWARDNKFCGPPTAIVKEQ